MRRWTPLLLAVVFPLLIAFVPPGLSAQEDPEEWGDAPEGGIAYPSTGVIGQFPTCSPGLLIKHGSIPPLWTYFGGTEDYETDGNAGACGVGFPPYDADECFQDGDAGLIQPQPYTISQGVVVPCGSMGTPL
jgi:hypothetical protein